MTLTLPRRVPEGDALDFAREKEEWIRKHLEARGTDGALQVELDRVRAGDQRQGARFAGVTQAKNRAVLSFSVPARVAQRFVASGSHVAQGAILALLDDREFRNAVSLARAGIAYISVMGGTYESFGLDKIVAQSRQEGYMLDLAAAIRTEIWACLAPGDPALAVGRSCQRQ